MGVHVWVGERACVYKWAYVCVMCEGSYRLYMLHWWIFYLSQVRNGLLYTIEFLTSLVPRPYFFLLLSLFIHKSQERHSEAAKKEMGVQLRKVSQLSDESDHAPAFTVPYR